MGFRERTEYLAEKEDIMMKMTETEIRNKAIELIEQMGITGEALSEFKKLNTYTQLQAIATFAHIGGDNRLREAALEVQGRYA